MSIPLGKNLIHGIVVLVLVFCVTSNGIAQDNDQPIAKIGNQTITEADLLDLANAVPERFRSLYLSPEGRQKTIEYIVNIYLLADEAEKQGLDKSPDISKLIVFTKKDILARKYMDKISRELPTPTDEEVAIYFEKNKAQYITPESVHLHHILVKSDKEAKDVMDRLKKGEKFADVATQVSICPSKAKGGNLDWLPKGSLVKEIEDVAFTMKPGQPVGPVQSKFGYHVLLLEDKKQSQQSDLSQVKEYIVEQLKAQKQQEQYEKVTENLRKAGNIQIAPVSNAKPAN